MIRCLLSIVVITHLLWPGTSLAQAQDSKAIVELGHPRPKVALVLAGGGAKGAAHMGVLKALEELKVPVDIVLGTSMGAYVAGLYSTGMSADEVESVIYNVDWSQGYRDRVSRSQRRVRDKEYEDRYQLTTDLGVGADGVRAPRGVVQGQNMLRILRETSGNLPPFDSFDDLPVPFRAVATDIIKLDQVVLDKGYLVDAMMASMSVPGALPPYQIDGRLLVDGGVTNNMPVDVARAMGADVVIAVDISTDYKNEEAFTTFLTVADQLSNYLVRRSTELQAETLSGDDVLLRPQVGLMETTDFDKMPQAFAKGYQAAMESRALLEKLALSSADYQHYIDHKEERRRGLTYGDEIKVDNIIINNFSHYSDQMLKNRLDLPPGEVLSSEQIEAGVQNLYALDRFKLIRYQYEEQNGANNLVIDVNEKPWGPNYLNFRFFLEDDFNTESQYSVGASLNFTDISANGAELALNFDIGTDKLVEAELYSPLWSDQKVFATAKVRLTDERRSMPVTGFDDTTLSASRNFLPVDYEAVMGELGIGYQDTLWRGFKIGGRYTEGSANYSTLPDYADMDFTRQGVFFNYRVDSLDDFSLPRDGFYINLEYLISHDDLSANDIGVVTDSSDTVYELSAKMIAAHSFDRHTLVGNIDYGEVRSKNSSTPIEPKSIGGFLNLSGIGRNSLIGQNKAYANLVYRYRWFDNDFGLFTSPVYLGASIEYGGVWSDPDIDIGNAPLYAASSLFAGVDSPIGPIMFGYGRTEQNFDSLYLILGTTFK